LWKPVLKRAESMDELLIQKINKVDLSSYPEFYSYKKPLEMGLWILWVTKEELGIKKLAADDIAQLIRDEFEISINASVIINAFNRAGSKIHIYKEADEKVYYEIMKPGKDHLISQYKEGTINAVYFEAGKRYTSKWFLSKNIIDVLSGDLLIVDPYCGSKTLDILSSTKERKISFLTKIENLREQEKGRFLRELQDFKTEHASIEFRNYQSTDLHDRYLLSLDSLVILGHSIKDIGSKESFAIILNSTTNKNMIETLTENFNRRWKKAVLL
jgi:hypothetical protein